MEQIEGIVEEVYIPGEGEEEILASHQIGFRVKTEKGIITIEEEQDERNCNILRGDTVLLTRQVLSNQEYIDIDKVEVSE